MAKKLALILRGISYYDGDIKICNSDSVNYKECLNSFRENLCTPLKDIFDQIDIFLVTYMNPKITEIITDYKPVDMILYPYQSMFRQNSYEITAKLMRDALFMVENYVLMSESGYDNILIIRFDMFYPRKFPIERVKLDVINFGWLGTVGQCDDCFHLFTPRHIIGIKEYLPYHNVDGYMHGLNHIFEREANYLCKRAPSTSEFYPDFYIFQRRLKEYNEGNMELIQILPNEWNWRVKPSFTKKELKPSFKHVVIITSCINPSNAPFSYSPVRSVFTPEERFEQTIESIQSVRNNILNAVIILINTNELSDKQHTLLIAKCDYVFIFDSVIIDNILFTADLAIDFPNKNCTEVASIYYTCQRIKELKLEYDYLWKLSGRYRIMPDFELERWITYPDKITVPPKQPNGSVNNVLYSIPANLVPKYIECLKNCYVKCYNDPDCSKGCMVEHTLFDKDDLNFLPDFARVCGYCSHLTNKELIII